MFSDLWGKNRGFLSWRMKGSISGRKGRSSLRPLVSFSIPGTYRLTRWKKERRERERSPLLLVYTGIEDMFESQSIKTSWRGHHVGYVYVIDRERYIYLVTSQSLFVVPDMGLGPQFQSDTVRWKIIRPSRCRICEVSKSE